MERLIEITTQIIKFWPKVVSEEVFLRNLKLLGIDTSRPLKQTPKIKLAYATASRFDGNFDEWWEEVIPIVREFSEKYSNIWCSPEYDLRKKKVPPKDLLTCLDFALNNKEIANSVGYIYICKSITKPDLSLSEYFSWFKSSLIKIKDVEGFEGILIILERVVNLEDIFKLAGKYSCWAVRTVLEETPQSVDNFLETVRVILDLGLPNCYYIDELVKLSFKLGGDVISRIDKMFSLNKDFKIHGIDYMLPEIGRLTGLSIDSSIDLVREVLESNPGKNLSFDDVIEIVKIRVNK